MEINSVQRTPYSVLRRTSRCSMYTVEPDTKNGTLWPEAELYCLFHPGFTWAASVQQINFINVLKYLLLFCFLLVYGGFYYALYPRIAAAPKALCGVFLEYRVRDPHS